MSSIRALQMFALFLLFSSFYPSLFSLASEPAQPPQPRTSEQGPKKIIPKQWHRPPAAYEITGGLWRVDHSFEARLQIKNHIQLASVTATPVLFMADGTEYALAPTELEPAGVTSLSINVALQSAPPEIVRHLSDFGSVAIRYNWAWPGALDATVQNSDGPRSLVFLSSLMAGMHQEPWRKHIRHKEMEQVLEGLWWKHDPDVGGFVGLTNTSGADIQARVSIVGQKPTESSSEHHLSICPHCTQMLDLRELLGEIPQNLTEGGLRLAYKGMPNTLAVTGGLENANEGFSASLPLRPARSPEATSMVTMLPQTLAGVGLMVGEPDSMMMFPSSVRFTPYAVLRNVGAAAEIVNCRRQGYQIRSPR